MRPRRFTVESPGTVHTTRPENATFLPSASMEPCTTLFGARTRIDSVQNPPGETSVVNDTADPSSTLKRRRFRAAPRVFRMFPPAPRSDVTCALRQVKKPGIYPLGPELFVRGFRMDLLETPKLVLEPLTTADYPWVVALYADPEVMRYIGDGKPRGEQQSRERLDWFLDQAQKLGFGYWMVRDRPTREPLGGAMLMVRKPGAKVEIGFAFARTAWGRGIATETARALIDHAFDTLGLADLEAFTHPDNAASGAVLLKAGMIDKGLATGPYGDVDRRYAVTRDEWLAGRSTRTG